MAMRRIVALFSLALLLLSAGCGTGAFFVGTGTHGPNIIIVSGTCTGVQLVNVVGPGGGFITITSVTLFNNGFSSNFDFCGNLVNQFALNAFFTIHFTNGSGCATPSAITFG
jgi:hypothetical protein